MKDASGFQVHCYTDSNETKTVIINKYNAWRAWARKNGRIENCCAFTMVFVASLGRYGARASYLLRQPQLSFSNACHFTATLAIITWFRNYFMELALPKPDVWKRVQFRIFPTGGGVTDLAEPR